jgi:hypothetical protein
MDEKPTPTQIIAGGESVPVELDDGTKTTVFVRQVKPSELAAYIEAEAKGEAAVLAMTAGIDDLDTITLDSYDALIEADARQNFTHARKREQREGERAARLMDALKRSNPDLHAELMAQAKRETQSLLSSLTPLPEVAEAGGSSPAKQP